MILNALLFTDVSILSLKCFPNLKNKAKLASTDASPMRNQFFFFFFIFYPETKERSMDSPFLLISFFKYVKFVMIDHQGSFIFGFFYL